MTFGLGTMKATLLRDKITKIISEYGDIDLFVLTPVGSHGRTLEVNEISVPSVRDFEKEDTGYISTKWTSTILYAY